MTSSGLSPVPVLVVAVVVLLAGVAAAVVRDDERSPAHTASSSSAFASTASTSTSVRSASSSSSPVTATTATSIATTVRPPVTSPEAAVNGLWAAYSANNQVAAQRFASDDVIRVLFESPYDGEQGTFQGCRPGNDVFDCVYLQPSTRYTVTVKPDAANGFIVVELTVAPV